jgi:hypothetical protein
MADEPNLADGAAGSQDSSGVAPLAEANQQQATVNVGTAAQDSSAQPISSIEAEHNAAIDALYASDEKAFKEWIPILSGRLVEMCTESRSDLDRCGFITDEVRTTISDHIDVLGVRLGALVDASDADAVKDVLRAFVRLGAATREALEGDYSPWSHDLRTSLMLGSGLATQMILEGPSSQRFAAGAAQQQAVVGTGAASKPLSSVTSIRDGYKAAIAALGALNDDDFENIIVPAFSGMTESLFSMIQSVPSVSGLPSEIKEGFNLHYKRLSEASRRVSEVTGTEAGKTAVKDVLRAAKDWGLEAEKVYHASQYSTVRSCAMIVVKWCRSLINNFRLFCNRTAYSDARAALGSQLGYFNNTSIDDMYNKFQCMLQQCKDTAKSDHKYSERQQKIPSLKRICSHLDECRHGAARIWSLSDAKEIKTPALILGRSSSDIDTIPLDKIKNYESSALELILRCEAAAIRSERVGLSINEQQGAAARDLGLGVAYLSDVSAQLASGRQKSGGPEVAT